MDCCMNQQGDGRVPSGSNESGPWIQQAYGHREVVSVEVDADPVALFEHLDDHVRLASHMTQSSAMMAGSSMSFAFNHLGGRKPGSRIDMDGKVLGIALKMSEIVVERDPPHRKVWETEGTPRLLVIGAYRMGFEIAPEGVGSRLRVFIEYDLPAWPWRLLGLVAAGFYARWCVRSMASDAVRSFADGPRRQGIHSLTQPGPEVRVSKGDVDAQLPSTTADGEI